MSARRTMVSMAPMAVASDGSILVNAWQLAIENDLEAAIGIARQIGLPVFVGVIVPEPLLHAVLHDLDDALADVAGRFGPRLLKRRRRAAAG